MPTVEKSLIFLASPLTHGPDFVANVTRAVQTSYSLLIRGYLVFCPHLFVFARMIVSETTDDFWRELALQWVTRCDMVVFDNLQSPGVRAEVDFAKSLGKKIVSLDVFAADLALDTGG